MGNPITTDTQIANLALSLIGQRPITDITDNSNKNSRECLRWYGNCRDGTLRRHYFNFAQARATLTKDAAAPEYEWDNRYKLPGDFIKLRKFNSYPDNTVEDLYQIEADKEGSKYLLTDDDTAEIRYTYRNETPASYDPLFIDALAFHLASKLARIISGSTQTPNKLLELYEHELSKAAIEDASENRVNTRRVTGLVHASPLRRRRFSSEIG